MDVIYVDDSVQPDPPRHGMGELVGIGGVMVPEESIAAYATALTTIRTRLGIPEGEEIKWKSSKGTFLSGAGGELVGQLRREMLEAAAALGIKSAVVIWDRGRVPWERGRVEREILNYLYERIKWHLDDHDRIGMIVADEPGGGPKAEKKWLAETLGLTTNGTRYAPPDRVVMPIVTAPSHHVPHLQLADLVTAATTAAIAGRPSAQALAPQLKNIAHTNSKGMIGGAGVVLWPPDLIDLYYWVFGDEFYVKNGAGHPLGPAAADPVFADLGRPYIRDDGLPSIPGGDAAQHAGKFVPCPTENCAYGEVRLGEYRDGDGDGDGDGSVVLAGYCDSCAQASVECGDCEAVTWLFDDSETQCDGCEAVYQQVLDRKGLSEGFRRVR